jgi:hypothetical protein
MTDGGEYPNLGAVDSDKLSLTRAKERANRSGGVGVLAVLKLGAKDLLIAIIASTTTTQL